MMPPAMAEEFVRARVCSELRVEWWPESVHPRGGGALWVGTRALEGDLDWKCVAWFEGLHYPHASWQEPVRVSGAAASAPLRSATERALLALAGHLDGLVVALRQQSEDTGRAPRDRAAAHAHMERSAASVVAVRSLLVAMGVLWPAKGGEEVKVSTVALLMRLPGANLYRCETATDGSVFLLPVRVDAPGSGVAEAKRVARAAAETEVAGSTLGRMWVVRVGGADGAPEVAVVFEVLYGRLMPSVPTRDAWRPPWEFGGWSAAALELARSEG